MSNNKTDEMREQRLLVNILNFSDKLRNEVATAIVGFQSLQNSELVDGELEQTVESIMRTSYQRMDSALESLKNLQTEIHELGVVARETPLGESRWN